MKNSLVFSTLAKTIGDLHSEFAQQASRAVNVSLTLRNWLIGMYVREYEQHGADRADYGEALLEKLADELNRLGVTRSQARELRRYRLFYTVYPQIRETLTPEFRQRLQLPAHLGVSDSQMAEMTEYAENSRAADLVQPQSENLGRLRPRFSLCG